MTADSHSERASIMGRTLLLRQDAGRLTHEGDTSVAADSHGECTLVVGRTLQPTQDAEKLAHGEDAFVAAESHSGCRPVMGHVTADAGRRQVDAWRRYFHDSEQPQGAKPRCGAHVTADVGGGQVGARRRCLRGGGQQRRVHSRCGARLLLTQAADRLAHGGDASVAADSHGGRSPVVGAC